MSEILESIFSSLCEKVEKLRSNDLQTIYQLQDAKDAKLAYELVHSAGLDVKLFSEDAASGKLYVENASLAVSEAALQAVASYADLLKKLKDVLDTNNGEYELSFGQSPVGARLTLQLPKDKHFKAIHHAPAPSSGSSSHPTTQAKRAVRKKEDDALLSGPAVARDVLPKSMRSSKTSEDSLAKRLFLRFTGNAFSSLSFVLGIIVVLGIIFSVLVTIKGFLCPDFATTQQKNPSYCPKPKSAEERALEQK